MNVRRVAHTLLRVTLVLALVGVVAVFVIMAVPGVIGAEHSYVVLSNSMAPEITPGDAVVVDEVDPTTIEHGDVITFQREADQPPVTHRVQSVRREGGELAFRTAGDNNEGVDPWTVGPESIVGTVWFSLPLVGHVVQFGNSTAGAAVLVGLPVALLVLSELWARAGEASVTREGSTAGADDEDDEVVPRFEAASVREGTDDGLRVSLSELRLGALGFGTFALYAIYVAVGTTNGVTVGVAVGATIAAIFHLGGLALFVVADRSSDAVDDPPGHPTRATDTEGADD